MFNSTNKVLLVLACILTCVIGSVLFTDAQLNTNLTKNVFSSPGYYYIDASGVSQHPSTAAITLTSNDLDDYDTGMQVVFKTERTNTNNANITLRFNRSPAKRLLTRQGQEFRILELEAGTIITATYDGAAFVSDYTAARSLKGRPVATAALAAGDYVALQYVGTWTIESGVTGFGTTDVPANYNFFNPDVATDAVLTLPTNRVTDSQLGWFVEILNGTTVVGTVFKNFGDFSAFSSRVSTDVDGLLFEFDFRSNGFGQTSPYMAFLMIGTELTIPAGYSIKVYLSEN